METTDKRAFKDALDLAYETVRQPLPSPAVLQVFWAKLERYPLDMVLRAISRHVDVSEFAPTPAGLLKHLPAESDGRPAADEAWAIALRSRDERDTVVWTQECAEAFSAALPVLEGGDEVGARMAFKAAYARVVERNRAAGAKPQWLMSLGHDPALREAAASDAVRTGRLSIAHVSAVVPALAAPDSTDDPRKAEEGLARLRAMVGGIPSAAEKFARARADQAELQRTILDIAKKADARRVAEYQSSHA